MRHQKYSPGQIAASGCLAMALAAVASALTLFAAAVVGLLFKFAVWAWS